MASKLHIAKTVPTLDKQDACQVTKKRTENEKKELRELTIAMIGFLKAVTNGELDD